jgi:hypothetical protein
VSRGIFNHSRSKYGSIFDDYDSLFFGFSLFYIASQQAIETVVQLKQDVACDPTSYPHLQIPNTEQEDIYDDPLAKIQGFHRAVNATSFILGIKAILQEKKKLTAVK